MLPPICLSVLYANIQHHKWFTIDFFLPFSLSFRFYFLFSLFSHTLSLCHTFPFLTDIFQSASLFFAGSHFTNRPTITEEISLNVYDFNATKRGGIVRSVTCTPASAPKSAFSDWEMLRGKVKIERGKKRKRERESVCFGAVAASDEKGIHGADVLCVYKHHHVDWNIFTRMFLISNKCVHVDWRRRRHMDSAAAAEKRASESNESTWECLYARMYILNRNEILISWYLNFDKLIIRHQCVCIIYI